MPNNKTTTIIGEGTNEGVHQEGAMVEGIELQCFTIVCLKKLHFFQTLEVWFILEDWVFQSKRFILFFISTFSRSTSRCQKNILF
jgi:hypothetical protein